MNKMAGILLFLLSCQYLSAQNSSYKDSLRKEYLSEKNDSVKTWKHIDLILFLLDYPEHQIEMIKEIETLQNEVQVISTNDLKFWALYLQGISLYKQKKYVESIIAIEKMNRIAEMGGLSEKAKKYVASSLISLGLNYSKIFDLENALINYQKAIRELEKFNDSTRLVLTYINMGYIFTKKQDWVSAKRIFENGLRYLTQSSEKEYAIILFASLSIAESRLGNSKESEININKAGLLKTNYKSVIADAFYEQSRGEIELHKKNYGEATDAFLKSLEYSKQWGDASSVAEAYEGLGRTYWRSGKNDLALMNILKSKELAAENHFIDQEIIVQRTLFNFYKERGLAAEAVIIADSLLLLNDKLSTLQSNNRLILLNALFETAQQTKQISTLQQENELSKLQLKQKNIINYILTGTAISLLTIFLLGYRNYHQKQLLHQQRIQELEKEKQLVATEAVLRGQEEERSRLAKDLHDGLGGMLSGIKYSFSHMKDNMIMTPDNLLGFERGLDMLDSSINELRRVAHSMMPEALLKSGLNAALKDFCAGINSSGVLKVVYQPYGIDDLEINPTTSITIYRIVQELLNNTIKHAAATQVVVQVTKENSKLLLTVEDDGKGFDISLLQQSKGIGWLNIKNRLAYLKGNVDIQSVPGKGTSVNIEIEV